MLDASTVRLVAVGLTGAFVALVLVTLRWGLGGRALKLRASTPVPRSVGLTWNVTRAVLFLYPLLVAAVPDAAYGTLLHFSFPFDTAVQILGILLWGVGVGLLLWCSRLLGPIMMTDGVVEGHELVTRGPYTLIRHPTYTALILVAFGVAMIFLSYVLLGLALLSVVLAHLQARGEERLLASPEGFREAYRAYMEDTGRFLPRLASRRP